MNGRGTGEHSTVSPVPPDERLASIDVLRGLALFGVLTVNLVTVFRVSIFQQFLPVEGAATALDRFAEGFVSLVLESKSLALFSLLFGVGLAIQFDRRGESAAYWLTRRLAVLLLFGLIHLLFIWNGDILTEYAIAGFIVLPFVRAPRWMLVLGVASLLALNVAMPMLLPWPDAVSLRQHVAEANLVYPTGSLGDVWRFSVSEIPLIGLLLAYVFPRTLALFLLGVIVWRTGLLRDLGRGHRTKLAVGAVAGIAAGAGMTAWTGIWGLGAVVLALGYASAVLALMQVPGAARLLRVFAPIGRMAFTNYVTQSLVFGYVFFGYGFGLFGKLGPAHALVVGIGVFVAQMLVSTWWLRRFRFGPLEWLWRTLMYGRMQPMLIPLAVAKSA